MVEQGEEYDTPDEVAPDVECLVVQLEEALQAVANAMIDAVASCDVGPPKIWIDVKDVHVSPRPLHCTPAALDELGKLSRRTPSQLASHGLDHTRVPTSTRSQKVANKEDTRGPCAFRHFSRRAFWNACTSRAEARPKGKSKLCVA